jgi:uncharacterized iron-regulated membrane protein
MLVTLERLVKSLRGFRFLHRWFGVTLAVFTLVMAVTGLILGWKKDVALLQPATRTGSSVDMTRWKALHDIARAAEEAMAQAGHTGNKIDRMDVRPNDGIVKVQFYHGYWEAQVDATTGKVLSLGQRHADWIEHVHDGSIINDLFKLIYTNLSGIGLVTLSLTGLWLWLGPKIIRRSKQLQNDH